MRLGWPKPKPGERVAQVPAEKVMRPGFHPQAGFTGQSLGDALGRDLLAKAQAEKLSTEDIRGMMERAKSWREGMLEGVAEVDQPDVMRAIGNELESSAAQLEGFGRTSAASALRRSREKLLRDWQEKMNQPAPKPEAPPLRPQGVAEIDLPAQMDPAGELTRAALEEPDPALSLTPAQVRELGLTRKDAIDMGIEDTWVRSLVLGAQARPKPGLPLEPSFAAHGEILKRQRRGQRVVEHRIPLDRETLDHLTEEEIRPLKDSALEIDDIMAKIKATTDKGKIDALTARGREIWQREGKIADELLPVARKRMLRQKLMRSGVGEDVRYHQTDLKAAFSSIEGGVIKGAPSAGRKEGLVFVTRTDMTKLPKDRAAFDFTEAFGPVRFVFNTEDLKAGGRLRPANYLRSQLKQPGAFEAEEIILPRRREFKIPQEAVAQQIDALHRIAEEAGLPWSKGFEDVEAAMVVNQGDNFKNALLHVKDIILGVSDQRLMQNENWWRIQNAYLAFARKNPDYDWGKVIRDIDGTLRAFGLLDIAEVPTSTISRIEIDPSAFGMVGKTFSPGFEPVEGAPGLARVTQAHIPEPLFERTQKLIEMAEDQGIPVFIRPLFYQTSVESYRPYIPPERVPDVVMRGPDSGQRMTQALRQGALTPPGEGGTSVERLVPALRQTEIRDEDMVGEFGRALGIDKDKTLTPTERGELLTERSLRPGWKEPVKDFLPRGPAFTPPEGGGPPVAGKGGGGAAPSPPSPPVRHTAEAVSGREPQDLWFWGRNFGSPQWVLDDPRDPLSQAIYTSQRNMRTDAGMRAWEYELDLRDFDKNLSGLGPKAYKESSRKIMRYLQAPEESADLERAWSGLSLKEKEAAREPRAVLIDFLKRWAEKKGVGKDLDLFPTGLKTIQNPLEFAGRILWGKEKFQTVGKNGNIVNVFPRELADMQIGDNPLFTHLPWSQGHRTTDAVGVVDALVRGIIREEVLEPNWKNMREAADALPRYKREYVNRWIERQQGRPSIWGAGLGERYSTTGARRQKSFFSTAVSEGADFLTMSLYRGFLNGSSTYNFDQFFGQTFQNLAAKHGPFAAFEGIAKHYQAAFDGVPKPVLMGAFEALFHDHQASTIGRQMNQVPGIRNFRRFWRDVIEPQTGPLTGEFMARSSAAHLALKQFVDETNLARGTNYTVRDMLEMAHAQNPLGQEAMYRIAIESERMHGVYGVDGQNPTLGMLIPRRVATLSTMFLHWYPKQAEFLFGPIVKERDPGILVNYMLLTGWLTNVMARSQGIDYERSSWFGAAPQARAGLPLPMGPAAQALAMFGMAADEEINGDPEQARRYYVELGGLLDAVVAGALHSPLGAPQLNKSQRFFQMLEQEALYTPGREVAELLEKEYGVPQLGGFPERMLQDRWGPTAPEQPGPIFGPQGMNPALQQELDGSIGNILRSEAIPRALGLRTLSDRQRRRIDQTIRRQNRLLQAEMTPLIERAVEVMREDANFTQNPEWQRVIQEAKDKGLPIEPGLEARVYQLVLPQLLRTFRASNRITRAMTKGMLDDLYPEIFADPIHPLKPSNWPEPSRTLPKGELPKPSSPFDPELLQEMQLQP